jgi:multisubunit Na+/H+ antiporter MnhE subunit
MSTQRSKTAWSMPAALYATGAVLWVIFVGSFRRDELIVGAVSVSLATLFLVFVLGCEELEFDLHLIDALQCLWIPYYIVAGLIKILVVLAKDLAQVEPAKSLFQTSRYVALPGPRGIGRQVLAVLYSTATPNFIVIGIDPEKQQMLYFQLEKTDIPHMTRNLGATE